jgi:hypothetical protein
MTERQSWRFSAGRGLTQRCAVKIARWPDHDPSRIAFGRGNGDFVLHAWRGHGELPDSDAEPPFADQHEPFVRRF